MKKILITRPKDQARNLEKFLQNHKFEVFVEPIFKVEKLDFAKITETFSAIIVTSVNAHFALEKISDKNIKIFTCRKKIGAKSRKIRF